jgi:hypothetical protein
MEEWRRPSRATEDLAARNSGTTTSAVGFGTVTDTKDAHGAVFESEQYAVVAEPQPKGASHIGVQRIHIARTGAGEAGNPFKEPHSRGLVQSADVSLGFIEPLNPVRWHLLVERKILGFEPELGQNVLHRNAFVALFKPGLPVAKALSILLSDGFIVAWGRGRGASDGVKQHELQEANCGGEL